MNAAASSRSTSCTTGYQQAVTDATWAAMMQGFRELWTVDAEEKTKKQDVSADMGMGTDLDAPVPGKGKSKKGGRKSRGTPLPGLVPPAPQQPLTSYCDPSIHPRAIPARSGCLPARAVLLCPRIISSPLSSRR